MGKRLVIYHGDCVDGFTAAWAIWHLCPGWRDAEYLAARYGDPPPDLRGVSEVLIVDFSYPRDVLMAMRERCRVRVLDHHKTAAADLDRLDDCVFDMERSGAGIAWDEYATPTSLVNGQRPWLVNYVEDRDLWRFALPESREINAFLRSQEFSFARWEELWAMDWVQAAARGRGCLDHINAYVRAAIKHAYLCEMDRERFPIVNVTYESCSEVADALLDYNEDSENGMAGYYFRRGDGRIQYGFRSRGRYDVAEFAKRFGGGGHQHAAGCVTDGFAHIRLGDLRSVPYGG